MGVAILAQANQDGGNTGQFLAWVGVLIVVVVIGTVVLLMVRRRMMDQSGEEPGGFTTMEHMRAMVARGEMSKEEYEQVRKAMITRIRQPQTTPDQGDRQSDGHGSRDGTGSTPFK